MQREMCVVGLAMDHAHSLFSSILDTVATRVRP